MTSHRDKFESQEAKNQFLVSWLLNFLLADERFPCADRRFLCFWCFLWPIGVGGKEERLEVGKGERRRAAVCFGRDLLVDLYNT